MTTVASESRLLFHELEREREDAGEGDANPRGAVVEFVEELVEGFLEQVGDEAELSLLRLRDEVMGLLR